MYVHDVQITKEAPNYQREYQATSKLQVKENNMNIFNEELEQFCRLYNLPIQHLGKILKDPKIIARGELTIYPEQSIFFHVRHSANTEKENDFMLTYLFYNKGKEINFIFRTKERRLAKVLTEIEKIVNSVKLL